MPLSIAYLGAIESSIRGKAYDPATLPRNILYRGLYQYLERVSLAVDGMLSMPYYQIGLYLLQRSYIQSDVQVCKRDNRTP